MVAPPILQKGDKIGIVSTARKISANEIKPAKKKLHQWGFDVVLGNNLFKEFNQFAGTDDERAADFQQMLDDDSVKAIFCARGGYGTIRMLDKINFEAFKKNPKWLIGYSDVTVLHSYFHKILKCETIHATMPINFPVDGLENDSLKTLHSVMIGENPTYEIAHNKHNRNGYSKGILVGGNLSILFSLRGTPWDIETSNKILFIEDLDEYLYHIDRMMMNLKLGGRLSNIKGLIIGGMSDMKDNAIPFGKNPYEIVCDAVKEYDFPILFNFPAGHIPLNNALVFGREIELIVDKKSHVKFYN